MKKTIKSENSVEDMPVKRLQVIKQGIGKRTPEKTPIKKVFEEFILEQKGKGNSEATIVYYEKNFKRLLMFLMCELVDKKTFDEIADGNKLQEYSDIITVNMLELEQIDYKFRVFLLEIMKVSEITVDTTFRAYRVFSYYCMREGWIIERKIKVKETKADIKDCYTEQEIKKLLKKPDTNNFTQYRNWVIVNYLLDCGNRCGSIVDIDIKDVDLDSGYVNVNTQKNKNPNRVSISKKMRSIMYEYITLYRTEIDNEAVLGNEPLFCNRYGERLTVQGLQVAIGNYNNSRGVEKTSIHLFRHTFAKNWVVGGGNISSLQKMLGQRSIKMANHYANLYETDIKDRQEELSILSNMPTTSGKTLSKRRKGISKKK